MSHPDPCYDPDNSFEDDMDYITDEDDSNYDDHDDFYEDENDSINDSMDGDFDSAMRDAGFGTDEDYGYYGGEDY